ncbi:MAG: hypothetical protein KC621_17445 [Myxococcales bacterium]|nr:hypothetical protein [Myxococcales bacterium]
MTLVELLAEPASKNEVVADCVRVIEEEVAARPGFSGVALRTGYKAFQKMRPNVTRSAIVRLMPDMAPVLDQHWAEAGASGDRAAWFDTQRGRVADDLLAVTDRLAGRSRNAVLLRLYKSLRGSARDHVMAGVPRLADLLRLHLGA